MTETPEEKAEREAEEKAAREANETPEEKAEREAEEKAAREANETPEEKAEREAEEKAKKGDKPSRAEKRIKQLLGKNKELEAENTKLKKPDEKKETLSVDQRVEKLETREANALLHNDIANQEDEFQEENKLSERQMTKICRIIDAEGLIGADNQIDFDKAMGIYNSEIAEDENEWKERTTKKKTGGGVSTTSSDTPPKPPKNPLDMTPAEIKVAGEAMLPD